MTVGCEDGSLVCDSFCFMTGGFGVGFSTGFWLFTSKPPPIPVHGDYFSINPSVMLLLVL